MLLRREKTKDWENRSRIDRYGEFRIDYSEYFSNVLANRDARSWSVLLLLTRMCTYRCLVILHWSPCSWFDLDVHWTHPVLFIIRGFDIANIHRKLLRRVDSNSCHWCGTFSDTDTSLEKRWRKCRSRHEPPIFPNEGRRQPPVKIIFVLVLIVVYIYCC